MITDDADRAGYTGCEPFAPGDDYDVMNSRDYENPLAPDRENKPYGWGIEKIEDPALEAANREMAKRRPAVVYTTAGAYARAYWTGKIDRTTGEPIMGVVIESAAYGYDNETRDMIWRAWSKWDRKLWERSERVWDRLCDRCKTHAEAAAKFGRWADRVTKTGGK